jgi:tetratricopeptide (TPR) repeat protein
VPVWHAATRKWVAEGRLVLLGVTQEQHADRCRLFAQWRELDWPILHDRVNALQAQAVPMFVAIDERGIVRSTAPRVETFQSQFIDHDFGSTKSSDGNDTLPDAPAALDVPVSRDVDALAARAKSQNTAADWRALGDALAVWHGAQRVDEAIDAYAHARQLDPRDGNVLFRLGVCHRLRHESRRRRAGDFQTAVNLWGKALAIDPNQYIWRRRIQQYGPRLDKPYPFYDWVEQARREIAARGRQPIALAVAPYGAELASPSKTFDEEASPPKSPDADGRIARDSDALIQIETAIVPARVMAGQTARVHVTLVPDDQQLAHWNNESEPLRLWVDVPEGWQVEKRLLTAAQGPGAESREIRRLDFEVRAPAGATGKTQLKAYALYNVCEDTAGACRFLRQDVTIDVAVDATVEKPLR